MRTILALSLGYILSIFYRSFLSVVAAPLSADLGIGPAELGALGASWFISFALMQLPVGYALDAWGPRRTLAVGMSTATLAGCGLALAPNYPLALVAMALSGAGCAPIFMSALYLFARLERPERFAGLASLYVALGSIGNLAGAAPLARLAEAIGWRGAMLGVAAVMALATVVALAMTRDPPRLESASGGGDGAVAGLHAILAIRPLWLLAPITLVSYAVLATARGLWIAPFLDEVHGLPSAARGDGALAMALTMTVGVLIYGALDRWTGRTKLLVLAGNAVMAALFIVLALVGERSPGLAIALFAGIGLVGFNYALLMAHARQFFPPHLIGRGVTAINFLFIAGTALMQVGSGWLVAQGLAGGAGPAATYATLHLVFGVLVLAALAVYALTPARPAPPVSAPGSPG